MQLIRLGDEGAGMAGFEVLELRVGSARPFGPRGRPSAIEKHRVAGPLAALATGLAGDEQGDPVHHGGRDKAVHAYPVAHYASWAAELAAIARHFQPGAFGENLVVAGVTEADIHLGDRWQLGLALLEVSQSRQPCWKLNVRFARPDMARLVQATGRTGWYFRVLEPGRIAAGETATLIARPHPDWPLDRVWRLLYRDTLDQAALTAFAALPELPEGWRRLAQRRLASGRVEDWRARLETPDDPPPA